MTVSLTAVKLVSQIREASVEDLQLARKELQVIADTCKSDEPSNRMYREIVAMLVALIVTMINRELGER